MGRILSALCLFSLLLLSQGAPAPAPFLDPVSAAIGSSFATPLALSGGLVAAEGLSLAATIPTWSGPEGWTVWKINPSGSYQCWSWSWSRRWESCPGLSQTEQPQEISVQLTLS